MNNPVLVHVLEGNCALLKLDNDVLVETVVPSTTQLGNEHRKLEKAKSQAGRRLDIVALVTSQM